MKDTDNKLMIPEEVIMNKIYLVRNQKVMLSNDLAELYQVETRILNQQVKRNIGRFPERYVFKLTTEEHNSLRSQFVTLKRGQHTKYTPYAFVLMLSNMLQSKRDEMVSLRSQIGIFEKRMNSILTKEILHSVNYVQNDNNSKNDK